MSLAIARLANGRSFCWGVPPDDHDVDSFAESAVPEDPAERPLLKCEAQVAVRVPAVDHAAAVGTTPFVISRWEEQCTIWGKVAAGVSQPA